MRYSIFVFQFLERRLRESIYKQFIIGGNLNPRSTRESTPNKINDISLGSIKEPVSCNSQATTLMAKRKGGQVWCD